MYMLKELIKHIAAFWMWTVMLWKYRLNRVQPNFIKEYLDIYYPWKLIVPLSVLNPLYDLLWWLWWVSLSYSSKQLSRMWLVRYRWKNIGALLIAWPSMLVERSKILALEPKFCYSELVEHLIKTKAMWSILDFYKEDIKKYVW